ncbi:MAG TPA: TGS domain-containing protein [Phycisphaerae bacterium]|nr:TGS domain-containing protein [Phycisphaerae bacterium]
MPANLTPQYLNAEKAFRAAKTVAEKIAALEEMYATIPKHKGTEKMQGDIKRKLAKFRQAALQVKAKGGVDPFHVEKHGAGQFVLFGMPNSGKSALVGAVTKAHVNVAPYPFATHGPVPGMMAFEDVQIQLVDLPPVTREAIVPGMMGTVRGADGILVCVDLSAPDLLDQVDACLGILEGRGMVPEGREVPEGGVERRILLVGTKADVAGAADTFAALKELHAGLAPMFATSAQTGQGMDELARRCFEMLDVVRVYSKEPGKPPDMRQPFILPRGSTVLDMAADVHREIAQNLKRARIWGGGKYDGQPVQRDHVLADRDVIELHV